jgi:hypothetical protein
VLTKSREIPAAGSHRQQIKRGAVVADQQIIAAANSRYFL